MFTFSKVKIKLSLKVLLFLFSLLLFNRAIAQNGEVEKITSKDCLTCHETGKHDTAIDQDLSHSIHKDLECLDCHQDKNSSPHQIKLGFRVGYQGCGTCHDTEFTQYKIHGRIEVASGKDIPICSDCHGDHDVLQSSLKLSKTHPANLPQTCGRCHEDLDLIKKHDILLGNPIQVYENSIHGQATKGGVYVAATCNDCHSTNGSAHQILAPGNAESSINHFNIPKTCGKCHKGVENDYWEGIHGKLVARGETDSPVCTNCHGEHGILSPKDPRSPVSKVRVAEATCSPCHESITLTEKYGLPTGRLTSFIDSYHGLKNKAGDLFVANCA